MALDSTKWEVTAAKVIEYTGPAHGVAGANYVSVLELHRWLQDLADAETISGNDYMAITVANPTDKKFDTIIQLLNGFVLGTTTTPADEYIYGGTIIQGSGGTEAVWDGISVISSPGVVVNVIQNNAVLSNDFWNNVPFGTGVNGINPDTANGLAMQFMVKVKSAGSFIDNGSLIFTTREWGKTFSEFRIPATGRGKNSVPLTYATDLNNATSIGTIAALADITNVTAGYNAINSLDYNDRYIGHTSPTAPYYAVTVAAGCDRITLDGVTFGKGGTIPDCHPYNGVFITSGATNIKVRNVGDDAAYLQTGVWAPNYAGMGVGFASGGNNNTVKLQRWFLGQLRTSLVTTINSDKNMDVEQVLSSDPWGHSAKAVRTEAIAWLNAKIKGLTSGLEMVTGQTSVYGTHWLDEFRGSRYGSIVLAMNEPTAETVSGYSNIDGVVSFNSAGGVEMRTIGAESIWEMPYFSQGHTGFANITPVMSGGTIGNYTITYQIDTGSGWNGTWKTLNTTNLTGETVSPSTGFKLKVKIVTGTTNSTAITFLRVYTTTTTAAQNAIAYPLDTVPVTITVKDASDLSAIQNARIRITTNVGGFTVLEGLTNASGILTGTTEYASHAITGTVRRASGTYGTLYKPGSISGTTTIAGFSSTILMITDE